MTRVHFLNVGDGDCSIIEHDSGRVSMIDICKGNITDIEKRETLLERLGAMSLRFDVARATSNHNMKSHPTNPIKYCKERGINSLFRFILTHPDMDHMDGFKNLFEEIPFRNFWHPGTRKEKPSFEGSRFFEEDWDLYQKIVDNKPSSVKVLTNLADATFEYANKGDIGGEGDHLFIVAPDKNLVAQANNREDSNDGSYVIVCKTSGGNIIFPGDAHDDTWNFVTQNYSDLVKDCAVLIAPHHGRDSSRSFDFLDVLKPRLTLFGNAPSEHLAYNAWNSRHLPFITNNQAGNIILEATSTGIDVYVENFSFAVQHQ